MTLRRTLTSFRDWAALLGALGMVGFLTFVPQHATTSAVADAGARRHAETAWPSRTAELSGTDDTLR